MPRAHLVGTMAHPLNRPRFDAAHGECVHEGYGILQPRVGAQPAGAEPLAAMRGCSAATPGIDPYTRAVSDVYQDVFGEGSFIGKGIYDVDAFERALDGRFPRTASSATICSKAAMRDRDLLSDVQLYEEYPSTLLRPTWIAAIAGSAATGRSHTGCCRRVPAHGGARAANPLSIAVAVEDPRQPPAQPGALRFAHAACRRVAMAALAGVLDPGRARHRFNSVADRVHRRSNLQKPEDVLLDQHVVMRLRSALPRVLQAAQSSLPAAVRGIQQSRRDRRTLSRLMVTRRRLLEWSTSGARPTRNTVGCLLAVLDVDRPRDCRRIDRVFVCIGLAMHSFIAGPLVLAVVWITGCRLVGKPSIAAQGAQTIDDAAQVSE